MNVCFLLAHVVVTPMHSGTVQRLQTTLLACLTLGTTLGLPQALILQTSAATATQADIVVDSSTYDFVVAMTFVTLFGVPAAAMALSLVPKRHFGSFKRLCTSHCRALRERVTAHSERRR